MAKFSYRKKVLALIVCATLALSPLPAYAKTSTANNLDSKTSSSAIGKAAQLGAASSVESATKAEKYSQAKIEGLKEEADSGISLHSDATASGTCGANATWELKDGVLTISGTGAIDQYITITDWNTGEVLQDDKVPWYDYRSQVAEVVIGDGITEIAQNNFCNMKNLKKVVIGNGVKKIGNSAFANDSSVTDLTIGNSVEYIYDDAFYFVNVTSLKLPASVSYISSAGLIGLYSLTSFEVEPGGTYASSEGVLYQDGGSTIKQFPAARAGEYTIPSTVTKIADSAFTYTSLTKITVPGTVKEIENSAFDFSNDLETLIIQAGGVTVIPQGMCYSDKKLTTVELPEGITTIEDTAFWCCSSLKTIDVPATVTSIGDAFDSTTTAIINNPNLKDVGDGNYVDAVDVSVKGQEEYSQAFQVLDLVNKERAAQGLAALTMDQSLLESAMQRAFESSLYWSHTRPSGVSCFTINSKMSGENIAVGQASAKAVMNSWMNSSGHRANILGSSFSSIGIGCVVVDGVYYWVQCFGTDAGTSVDSGSYSDKTATRTVMVAKDKKYYTVSFELSASLIKVGKTAKAIAEWDNGFTDVSVLLDNAVVESSDSSVCTVKGAVITGQKAGTSKITMYYKDYKEAAETKTLTVKTAAYKVSFNANGGKVSTKSKTVTAKSKIGTLPKPTRKGYTFWGWYTKKSGGSEVTKSTQVSKKQTLYAHWKKGKQHKLSFNANGGKVSTKSKAVKPGKKAGSLPKAKRSGYTFKGWYTAKSGGKKVTKSTKISKKRTLYAHWKKK